MFFPVSLGSNSAVLVSQSLWGRGVLHEVVWWPQSPRSRSQWSWDWRRWVHTLGNLRCEVVSSQAKWELSPPGLWVISEVKLLPDLFFPKPLSAHSRIPSQATGL